MAGRVVTGKQAETAILQAAPGVFREHFGVEVALDHRPDQQPGIHLIPGGVVDALFRPVNTQGTSFVAEITQLEPIHEMQGTPAVVTGDRLVLAGDEILVSAYPGYGIQTTLSSNALTKPLALEEARGLMRDLDHALRATTADEHGIRSARVSRYGVEVNVSLMPIPNGEARMWAIKVEMPADMRAGTVASMQYAFSTNHAKLDKEKVRFSPAESVLILDAWDVSQLSTFGIADAFAHVWRPEWNSIDHVLVARSLGGSPSFFPLKVGQWRYTGSYKSFSELKYRMRIAPKPSWL